MELKDFVKTTIIELQGAIDEIAVETGREYIFGNSKGILEDRGGTIKFDVALQANDSKSGKGNAGIQVPLIRTGFGVGGAFSKENNRTTRIQFDLVLQSVSLTKTVAKNVRSVI